MMKKLVLLMFIAGIVFGSIGCGTSYRMQQGALVGATVGALVGHDIGEDTESTLIGAAVGGVAGAVVGDAVREYERNNPEYPYYNQKASQNYPPPQR